MSSNEKARQAAAAKAHETRVTRRQGNVQNVAADIQSQIGNMSPEVAERMGAPLDPTGGYDFTPGARPQDLPQPGSTPGGAAEHNPQSFDGQMIGSDMDPATGLPKDALEDDHDALLGPGIGPPSGGMPPQGPPPQQPQQPQQPQFKPGEVKPEHPILSKLRQDLGIDEIKAEDVTVGGHKWTLSLLTPQMLAMASRLADSLSESITERQLTYQAAIVSYSVIAIDGVPAYQVFGVETPPAVQVTDPLNPPRPVRYLGAYRVFSFIHENARTQLPQRLWDAYEEKIDQLGGVSSQLDDPAVRRTRFKCTEEVCGHEIFIPARTNPGTNDIQLPFCMWHGTPMIIAATEEEKENPLP